MKSKKAGFGSMDDYISTFPNDVQKKLEELRATIKAVAPRAQETISYQMAAFMLDGRYIAHFAAWKKHIGMYPIPAGDAAFQKEVTLYKGAKSSLNFPLDKPLPLELISKIVKFRIAETLEDAEIKSNKKK
jgi:uncharacterized protein YdhG (YjbR/CyaY superfamily)